MTTALVVITDGRGEFLTQTIASAKKRLAGHPGPSIMVDDSGILAYGEWLDETFPEFDHIHHPQRLGLAAAVRSAWEAALDTAAAYTFHLEDDFIFSHEIDLLAMERILEAHQHLAHLVVKRAAANPSEEAAGGPYAAADCIPRVGYVEHRQLYSFNPHLVPARVMRLCLDEPGDGLERGFTDTLLRHDYSFAYYGSLRAAPRCEHIGWYRGDGWKV